MKRMIVLLLAVLMLAGCAAKPQETTPTDPLSTTPTQQTDPTLSDPNGGEEKDPVIQQISDAVYAVSLPQSEYSALYPIGSNLLAVGAESLTVLPGNMDGAAITYKAGIAMHRVPMDTAPTGVAYYHADSRQVIVLNPQLQKVAQLQLPENIVGTPAISLARKEIYYSNGKELRAMHMDTCISRMLRQLSEETYIPQAVCFDGTVLLCKTLSEDRFVCLSVETGQTVSSGTGLLELATDTERYYARMQDGSVQQLIFGTDAQNVQSLMLPQAANAVPVLAMNGVVRYEETQETVTLSFYDLQTGKCTAKTELANAGAPTAFSSDGAYVFMLARNRETNHQMLYRWDIGKSKIEDSTIYTDAYYTAENPDVNGLEMCRRKADALEQKYSVELTLWTEAAQNTGAYSVVPEHQPQMLLEMLEQLEAAFAQFPENFLQKTLNGNKAYIALVRSIDGSNESVQFWRDGDYRMILSSCGNVTKDFYRCIAYGIDSHVLGNSRDFDTWNGLNPEGFAYGDTMADQSQYLEGENRAFTDPVAMRYPYEDRCRVFCNAMLAENGEMFQSKTMQAKLLRLCKGIREAYGLEKSTETYVWEQYLQTSLAYKK